MKILDGKLISEEIKRDVEYRAKKLISDGIEPKLAVIMIGEDLASEIYVNHKKRFCQEVGVDCEILKFKNQVPEEEIISLIKEINSNKKVHGVIVQLPVPKHISKTKVIQTISPRKDVDGFTEKNLGKTFLAKEKGLLPATPAGILKILDKYSLSVKGKNCVIVGHSRIVGKPLSMLLLSRDATVTVTHIFTKNLGQHTRQADFVFSAVGKAKLLKANMLKDNFIGIDIGISRDSQGKIAGDFDFSALEKKAQYLTPVPGGVGPVTVATLCENVIKAAEGLY